MPPAALLTGATSPVTHVEPGWRRQTWLSCPHVPLTPGCDHPGTRRVPGDTLLGSVPFPEPFPARLAGSWLLPPVPGETGGLQLAGTPRAASPASSRVPLCHPHAITPDPSPGPWGPPGHGQVLGSPPAPPPRGTPQLAACSPHLQLRGEGEEEALPGPVEAIAAADGGGREGTEGLGRGG